MLLSHKRHFVFIHIPKTAGMSVHQALVKAAPDGIRRIEEMPAFHDPSKQRHVFAQDLRGFLGPSAWNELFSFAFVRNPWARLVSWYNMCHERPSNRFMRFVKCEAPTFSDFLLLTSDLVTRTHFNQIDYVTDSEGEIIVDFIGRYEQLEKDFSHICEQLGINTELPHINASANVDYRTYYDRRSRQLVAERFYRDIEVFGYEF